MTYQNREQQIITAQDRNRPIFGPSEAEPAITIDPLTMKAEKPSKANIIPDEVICVAACLVGHRIAQLRCQSDASIAELACLRRVGKWLLEANHG